MDKPELKNEFDKNRKLIIVLYNVLIDKFPIFLHTRFWS